MAEPPSSLSEAPKLDDVSVLAGHSGQESINHMPEESAAYDSAYEDSPTDPEEDASLFDCEIFFDGALRESIRPISRFTGEAGEYQSRTRLRGAARGSSRLVAIAAADFETNFLHKPKRSIVSINTIKIAQKKYMEALEKGGVKTEAALGPIVCQTLNQLSCTVAQKVKVKRAFIFFDTHNKCMIFKGRFEGQNLRPDFMGKLIPLSEAKLTATGNEDQIEEEGVRTLRWSDVHTMCEFMLMFNVGHQQMLMDKRTLHRDVSRGNILLNPKHHGCKVCFTVKKGIVPFIPIEAVLKDAADRSEDFEESGALTDLDCGAGLSSKLKHDGLTDRTGTPKFVAIGVAGGVLRERYFRSDFPVLSGRAAQLYKKTYGEEVFRKFPELVNATENSKDQRSLQHIHYRHQAYHDIESFYWVLLHELVLACPEGKEDEMSAFAVTFLKHLRDHAWEQDFEDQRTNYLNSRLSVEKFRQLFHPDLQKFAPIMHELMNYLAAEWGYWAEDKLPPDHCHEAMKRLLLKALLMLKDDEIKLREEPRKIPNEPGKGHGHHTSHITGFGGSSTSPMKNKNKRSHIEDSGHDVQDTSVASPPSSPYGEIAQVVGSQQKKRRISLPGSRDESSPEQQTRGSDEVKQPVKPAKTSRGRSKDSQSKSDSTYPNASRRTTRSMSKKGTQ